jgi:hypothetical protein
VNNRALVAALLLPLAAADAQQARSFVFIGSVAEDRARLDQLRGLQPSSGWLVRTPSLMSSPRPGGFAITVPRVCTVEVAPVPVTTTLTWNSDIPFARNDGGVWAGRGTTIAVAGGVRGRCGMLRAQFVPEGWHARNANFQVLPSGNPNRSDFANPFHSIPQSAADLPLRFGARPISTLQPGQTSVSAVIGPIELGWSMESQWWGPGIRNALVMSNNAVGIPSYFLGTPSAVRTRAGALSARWIAGYLTESPFYERQTRGFERPLSGLVITLAPAVDSNLTIGAARVVYRRLAESTVIPTHAFDAVTRWTMRKEEGNNSSDQLTSVFARWVFPASGLETYAEVARVILPSLRQLLIMPQYSQGYTLGLQWLSSVETGTSWRTQLEVTNLEMVRLSRTLSPPSFYTSPTVLQGYTQRGRVIGATIGPGSQSQWFALDRVTPRWSGGIFGGRIRWDHDEYFPQPSGLSIYGFDVSLYAGLRATYSGRYFDYSGELLTERRMNYLFQSAVFGFGDDRTFDVHNVSLRLSLAPGGRPRK